MYIYIYVHRKRTDRVRELGIAGVARPVPRGHIACGQADPLQYIWFEASGQALQ